METPELLHIQSLINKLEKKVDKALEEKNVTQEPMSSKNTDQLAEAFAQAQAEIPQAQTTKTNPYLMTPYTDFKTLIETTRPSLTKYGLSVRQPIIEDEHGMMFLYTILQHSSGQWTQAKMRLKPQKNDVQTIESYIALMKRMAYGAFIGTALNSEDDDGERAVADERYSQKKGTALNTKYDPREETTQTITKEQLEEIEYELAEYPDIAEKMLETLKVTSLANIPKSKYRIIMQRIREIKNARNNT